MGPHDGSLNADRLLDPPHVFEQNTGKESLVFPGESPDVVTFEKWREAAARYANTRGWLALVKGSIPPALIKHKPKDLTTIPELVVGGDVTAAMVETRAQLRATWMHDNLINKEILDESTRGMKDQFADWLAQQMRPRAGIYCNLARARLSY